MIYKVKRFSTVSNLSDIKIKTKEGVEIKLVKSTNFFIRLISKIPAIKRAQDRSPYYNIVIDGKNIGELNPSENRPDEVNIVWLGVDDSYRGHGIAQIVLTGLIDYLKGKGVRKITLEVPGNSPDAKHIYEKLGFKVVRVLTTSEEDTMWGGLTEMELKL